MQLLREEWDEADILAELIPTLRNKQIQKIQQPAQGGLVTHSNGQYYFITPLDKRLNLDGGQLVYRCSSAGNKVNAVGAGLQIIGFSKWINFPEKTKKWFTPCWMLLSGT